MRDYALNTATSSGTCRGAWLVPRFLLNLVTRRAIATLDRFDELSQTLLDVVRATIATLSGWWLRRRATRQLSAFDDYMLRDLGLTRGSIDSAVRHGRI